MIVPVPNHLAVAASIINIDVYWGESGMDGRAYKSVLPSGPQFDYLRTDIDCIRVWDVNTSSFRPLNGNNSSTLSGRFGPEVRVGQLLKDHEAEYVAFVKVAAGGSGIDPSLANSWAKSAGVFYPILIDAVTDAIAALTAEGWSPRIRSVNVDIGLNDANNATATANWATNLPQMIQDLRTDLPLDGVPFNCILPHVDAIVTDIATIRTGWLNLEASDSLVSLINIDDLLLGDNVHLETFALLTESDRFFNLIKNQ